MEKYKELTEARELFGIAEAEALGEIRRKITTALKRWHPDTGDDRPGERKEKTVRLLEAKKLILDYCDAHKISFSIEEVGRHLSPGELWMKNFGDDHIWSGGGQ